MKRLFEEPEVQIIEMDAEVITMNLNNSGPMLLNEDEEDVNDWNNN